MDICKQVDPVMVEIEPAHIARCHLFEQPVTVISQNHSDDEPTDKDVGEPRPNETVSAALQKGD
jgi:hypothetical protein